MKKLTLYFIGLSISFLAFSSCGSAKSGCGLTSDSVKMQPVNMQQNTPILAKN